MGGVAEIEIAVASTAGDQVRASRDGLRFERLEWRFGRAFGGHDGRDGGLTLHGHDGEQMPGRSPNL
jgi:hypothetical protein